MKGTGQRHRKGYRLLAVGGREWQWKLGRRYVNAICEDGRRARSEIHEILELTEEEWCRMVRDRRAVVDERAIYGPPPRNERMEMTPRKVQEWIKRIA